MENWPPEYNRAKVEKSLLRGFAFLLLVIGSVTIIVFALKISGTYGIVTEPNKLSVNDMSATGQFGDFVGGFVGTIFNLVGALLLFYTLREQRDNFKQERLENRFFEMVKIHRDNVEQMKYAYYERKKVHKEDKDFFSREENGRKIFRLILDQFRELYKETEHLFEKYKLHSDNQSDEKMKDEDLKKLKEVYANSYLQLLSKNKLVTARKIDLVEYARIDLLYLIIFFGVGEEGRETIDSMVKERYEENFYKPVLVWASLKPVVESKYWDDWRRLNNNDNVKKCFEQKKIVQEYLNKENGNYPSSNQGYFKYYGGHQFRLGHYFRHLYQTVKYIDGQKILTYEQKYAYIKILRAQLSNFEQRIFFLNSLSVLGRINEMEKRESPFDAQDENDQLVTKYNLIKNIPNDILVGDIRVKRFYPEVSYECIENEAGKKRRKVLIKQYTSQEIK